MCVEVGRGSNLTSILCPRFCHSKRQFEKLSGIFFSCTRLRLKKQNKQTNNGCYVVDRSNYHREGSKSVLDCHWLWLDFIHWTLAAADGW